MDGTEYSASGTDVKMQIRFFKVMSVTASEGLMRLKVWMRLVWTDARLSWDPAEYGNVTTIYFQGMGYAGAEDNEIWIVQPAAIELLLRPSCAHWPSRVSAPARSRCTARRAAVQLERRHRAHA